MRTASRAAALLLALSFAGAPLASATTLLPPGAPPPEALPEGAEALVGQPLPMRVPHPMPENGAPEGVATVRLDGGTRTPLAVRANWTMLVYMVADNDLEPFGIQDINEMEAAPDDADVHVVVEVDRSSRYDTSNGDWSTTQRLEVRHDNDTSTIGSLFLADLGEQNMGDPQTLADFLTWGVDAYPADHYLVILWDHGYGWSGGIGNDLHDGDHLTVTELGSAIGVAADHLGRPFDIIAFDACLMQQVEVLYEIGWLADAFVAAEDLEPATGWPYEEMVAALQANARSGPLEVATALSSAYMDFYGTQGETMMSAVDAKQLRTGLAAALNRLSAELSALVEDPKAMGTSSVERAIWNARDMSPAMFITDYIDLGDFARRLEEDARIPPPARAAAAGVRSAINLTVIQESHSVYRPGLTGLTVYLPATAVPLRYTATRWANESLWDEFAVAFLSGTPRVARLPTLTVSSPADGTAVARSFTGSFSVTQQVPATADLEVKVGWGNWTRFGGGSANFSATGVFDAGPGQGGRTVSFRAVSATGGPSPSIERALLVVADPVLLGPVPNELVVAQNRTTTVTVNATLRDPYTSFNVAWRNLPPGVTNAGPTTFTPPSPGSPVSVALILAASPTAGPSGPAMAVFTPAAAAGLETVMRVEVVVTQPLPDLVVLPISLDTPLPWPGDTVNISAVVVNAGFEDSAPARVVGAVATNGSSATEALNLSVGVLAPGQTALAAFNWTVTYGLHVISVQVEGVPPGPELSLANNVQTASLNMTPFGFHVAGPVQPAMAAGPGNGTQISLEITNVGTQADNYTVSAAVVSNQSAWGVTPPAGPVFLAARSLAAAQVTVTTPALPVGGERLVLDVTVLSQGQPGLEETVRVEVVYPQVHAGSVRASPDDVELPFRGNVTVSVTLRNEGNGPERYTLLLQNGEPLLSVTAPATAFDLGPGQQAAFNLTLFDGGLVSADRPYAVEVVAAPVGPGDRISGLVSVRVEPHSAVSIQPIERTLQAVAGANTTFHANVTNTGNTYAVVALSASAEHPELEAGLPGGGLLLPPGTTAVVNGSARFATPPRAGDYTLTLQAADTRGGGNSSSNLTVSVPEVHGIAASAASSPTGEPTPTLFVRQVRLENTGNTDETVLLVIGFVPVGLTVTIEPPASSLAVPAFGNTTFLVRVERSSGGPTDGQIDVLLTVPGGSISDTVTVAYGFPPAPEDTTLLWGAIVTGAAGGVAVWLYATRPRRKRP